MSNPAFTETGRPPAPERSESLRDVNKVNRTVYLTLIGVLGTTLIVGVGGWLVLAFANRTMPEGLAVIIGAIAGGLVGLISGKSS